MIKEKTIEELLGDLQKVINTLKVNLPKEALLIVPKSIDPQKSSHLIDPLRLLHLREACFHRITELADSGCDAFKKGNVVTGYLLMRALIETFALFWYLIDQVEEAVKYGDVEELRRLLTRMAIGIRSEKENAETKKIFGEEETEIIEGLLTPIQVHKLIGHVGKKIPAIKGQYEFLCEIAHPNCMDLIKAYVKNDWGSRMAYFGKDKGDLRGHLDSDIQALILLLEGFMGLYEDSLQIFRLQDF